LLDETVTTAEVAADGARGKLAKCGVLLPSSGCRYPIRALSRPRAARGSRSPFPAFFADMDDHQKQLLLLGREHYEKGEHDKAEYLLRQLVEQSSHFADVYDMLGVIAHTRGDFVEAEKLFNRAVELNPNYTEAQLNLMVTCNELGKYDRARKIYRQVRHKAGAAAGQTDPFARGKIANMHAATSQAYQDAGMASEAVLELEKAVLLCPSFADLRTKLAQLYRDAGDNGRAIAQLEAAKEANPRYLNARLMLGVLLLTTGERQRATKEFEAALEIEPENQRAEMYLRIVNSQVANSEAPSVPPSES